MARRRRREVAVFSLSFLDVLSNTIGGLALLLLIAVLMMGGLATRPPVVTTESLPDAFDGEEYSVWLGAREGGGAFLWSKGPGEWPEGLELESGSGKLSGRPRNPEGVGSSRYEFEVLCAGAAAAGIEAPTAARRLALLVQRAAPAASMPLRIVSEPSLPDAQRDQPFPLALAAEGGQAPYRWSWKGRLPAGIGPDEQGRLSGSPSETGAFPFAATVRCPGGETATREFLLRVVERHPPPPPVPPLRAVTSELPPAVAGRSYVVFPAAEGGSPPYAWSAVEGCPAWLQRRDDAGFGGLAPLRDAGVATVVWEVSDSAGRSARTGGLKLEVVPPPGRQPPPLRIRTRALPDARVGSEYELAVAVEGGVPPYRWTHSGFGEEFGVSFRDDDGAWRGSPVRPGRTAGTVTLVDAEGQRASQDLALRVDPQVRPVTILTTTAVGRAHHGLEVALAASGGIPPYRWALAEGALPPGLTLEPSSGRIVGTPASAGRFHGTFTAQDAAGTLSSATRIEFDMLTSRGVRPLVVRTDSVPVLLRGGAVQLALACEGGEPPYGWTAEGGLPPGLRVDGCRIAGKPEESGEWRVRLVASDASGESAPVELPIEVRRVSRFWVTACLAALLGLAVLLLLLAGWRALRIPPLEVATESIPNARASAEYSVQLACTGGTAPYRWRLSGGTLPPGLELSESGRLSGCPFTGLVVEETQEFRFTVEVTDRRGRTAMREL